MIKKHQKGSIYGTYQSTSLKQPLKTLQPSKENSNIEENLCVFDKGY